MADAGGRRRARGRAVSGLRVLVVGDVALDVLVAPVAVPVAGADVPARIRTRPGGAGANTAAWLAHLGRDAGIAVTLAARVGADPAGRAAAAELAAAGVTAHLAVDPEAATCTVVSLLGPPGAVSRHPTPRGRTSADVTSPGGIPRGAVPPAATPSGAGPEPASAAAGGPLLGPGDRTLLSDRGAAALLGPDDLPDVAGFDHLHLSGYVLLDASSRAAGRAALAAARAAGTHDVGGSAGRARPRRTGSRGGVPRRRAGRRPAPAQRRRAARARRRRGGARGRSGRSRSARARTGASWADPTGGWHAVAPARHRRGRDRRGRRLRRGRARGLAERRVTGGGAGGGVRSGRGRGRAGSAPAPDDARDDAAQRPHTTAVAIGRCRCH